MGSYIAREELSAEQVELFSPLPPVRSQRRDRSEDTYFLHINVGSPRL